MASKGKILNLSGFMGLTTLALLPALLVQTMFWGWGPLLNVIIAVAFAMLAEAACVKMRNWSVRDTLQDGSAILAGVIFALCLPPQLSPGLVVLGAVFMMVFGKHIFGGIGANPFNPAMLAYIMLLLSFPIDMTDWLQARAWENLGNLELVLGKFGIDGASGSGVDVFSAPTALDSARTFASFSEWESTWDAGRNFPFVVLAAAYAGGGIFLLARHIITWHIPVAVLVGLLLPAAVFSLFSESFAPASFHLVMGGSVFCAFFVATDPVSAATNRVSRLVYGVGIGLFIYIIRTWGGYADAVAFAVLFFNFCAPFMDKYLKPRVYGE